MTGLFLYANGPRGDVMFCRAVYRLVAAHARECDVVLGACRDDAPLLADIAALAGPRCRVLASDFANTAHGAVLDLEYLRPAGCAALEVWLGGNERFPSYQWADVVESLQHDLRDRGVELDVDWAAVAEQVPMLDFASDVALPALRRPSIWIDNERTAHEPCWFMFDLERLACVLPGFDLLCTAPPGVQRDNVVDVSGLEPIRRQKTSEQCVALVGLTMDPFNLTLTEANRWKPKALCGYDARTSGVAWDYAGNPLELLATMDELVDHLLANVATGVRA